MTIAEFFLALILLGAVYFLLKPLQRRLESVLLSWMDPRRRKVVDVDAKPGRPSQKE
jgi:hypothetical protein